MVLVCKDDAKNFSAISPAAFAELGVVTGGIEVASKAFCDWQKINYLMLMMVDPDVHFHVLPRYDGSRDFDGTAYLDAGWPGQPDLASAVTPSPGQTAELTAALKAAWPNRKDA